MIEKSLNQWQLSFCVEEAKEDGNTELHDNVKDGVPVSHLEPSVPGEPDSKKPQGSSRTSLNWTVTWGPSFFLCPCLLWVQTS